MAWHDGLSREEIREMTDDTCAAYEASLIDYNELRLSLAKLGYNATEIAEYEKQFRPKAPENEYENSS